MYRGLKVSAPTHELGISIQGPAIGDIEATFLERWNDGSVISVGLAFRTTRRVPFRIGKAPTVQAPQGPHSVQVLRTYGRVTQPIPRYTWSSKGDFTIWSSFLNAIQKATSYIYIEDQYFIPFGFPVYCVADRPSVTRDTDLFYQLGEALKRGVKILAVVPHRSEDPVVGNYQNYQKAIGIQFLKDILGRGATGDLVVMSLFNGNTSIFVHSKLMIVDDGSR